MVALAACAIMSSCTQDEINPNSPDVISQEVKDGFMAVGHDVTDIKKIDRVNPLSGEREIGYLLEGDMFVPEHQAMEIINKPMITAPEVEQYRTNNLVSSGNYNISIIGYTGSGYALTSKMQTGLQWAVNNYNRLSSMGLNFSLSYAASTNADMVVYNNGASGGGGSAGFPSGGQPYKWIQINAGTNSFSTNVNEHVITHEIGHCVGFRHTDFFDRSYSCGSGGNEGDGGVGAVHIPGTSTGIDANSIMLACFSSSADGEFGSGDITALQYLY